MAHPKSWYQTFWTGQGIGALKGYKADEERYQESPCQRGLRYLRFLGEPRNCGMRPVELRVCVGPEYMIFMAGGRDVQDPSITLPFGMEHTCLRVAILVHLCNTLLVFHCTRHYAPCVAMNRVGIIIGIIIRYE